MERTLIESVLQAVCRILAMLSTDDLAKHVTTCKAAQDRADSFGPMFDPTGWMKSRASGETEDAKLQLKIVNSLLSARQAMDEREKHVTEVNSRRK